MPHLTVCVAGSDLRDREALWLAGLTETVVGVYGEWVRPSVDVLLIEVPPGRWSQGGGVASADPAPRIRFGVREVVFSRPDADEVVRRLIMGLTDAVVGVVGQDRRAGIVVELVAEPDGRVGVGGDVTHV